MSKACAKRKCKPVAKFSGNQQLIKKCKTMREFIINPKVTIFIVKLTAIDGAISAGSAIF